MRSNRYARARCAHPAHNPDWWDTAAPPADRRRAHALCSECPAQQVCAADAAAEQPTGVIRAGKSWSRSTKRPASTA